MNPHLLFVDDEAPLRELLALYFRKKGFDVSTAASAPETRELLANTHFDLAILDLNLGGADGVQDGLDLFGFVRTTYPDLPAIIFTGLDLDEGFLKKALAGRASGFMRKSDSLESLLAEVRRHLPGGSSR